MNVFVCVHMCVCPAVRNFQTDDSEIKKKHFLSIVGIP